MLPRNAQPHRTGNIRVEFEEPSGGAWGIIDLIAEEMENDALSLAPSNCLFREGLPVCSYSVNDKAFSPDAAADVSAGED